MTENNKPFCPECNEQVEAPEALDRRGFIRVLGTQTTLLAAGSVAATAAPRVLADEPAQRPAARNAKPAEALIQELYNNMTAEQKRSNLVLPWNHASRRGMFNSPINQRIGQAYTQAQQELIQRILRSIASDEEGYARITRNGTFDGSRSLQGCGANIFGDPTNGRQFAWVFSGHHLTVRCDGNSEPDAAFGGPMYYGHSPHGYSNRNCFYYQTRSVLSVFDSLTEAQRRQAVVTGSPGELAPSVQFRNTHPGIPASELTADQKRLVETVMRDVLSPYRREDGDEVMQLVRRNGGLERIHLVFYRDRDSTDAHPWHFWRLEGPGFVWNYRVLPHVHTYVNIAAAPARG
ncbi:MAG TPA: DUF3500 domain-containing protein [Gemmataceae bacterium]|nr:DUF3500 domain-containing protein [Gemmataceae bacterium]